MARSLFTRALFRSWRFVRAGGDEAGTGPGPEPPEGPFDGGGPGDEHALFLDGTDPALTGGPYLEYDGGTP